MSSLSSTKGPLTPEAPRAPIDPATAQSLQHLLDTLEEVAGFTATTGARVDLVLDRLVSMQALAENVVSEPGTVDDRELACAKIGLLAQQLDVIARKPVFQDVPVLEGGRFHFALAAALPDMPESITVEVPNLRARGADSLGLFEHVDAMLGVVGPGGRVDAAYESDVVVPDETKLDGPEVALEGRLPEGTYEIELFYLAMDASNVRVTLRRTGETEPLVVAHTDLSAEDDAQELDLQVGLTLVLDRIARSDEIEIETQTVQRLEWRHEVGERLESVEGWFHETVQPRDFELYALYLESPLTEVKKLRSRLEEVESNVEQLIERVTDRIAHRGEDRAALERGLVMGSAAWSLVDDAGLLDALVDGD